jgi:hypothetical protein
MISLALDEVDAAGHASVSAETPALTAMAAIGRPSPAIRSVLTGRRFIAEGLIR